MKKWCKHILFLPARKSCYPPEPRKWYPASLKALYYMRSDDGVNVLIIPRSWKMCPICGTPRPGTLARREWDQSIQWKASRRATVNEVEAAQGKIKE